MDAHITNHVKHLKITSPRSVGYSKMSSPASRARDYSKQIDWLYNLEIQICKSVVQSCYYGTNALSEEAMALQLKEAFPKVYQAVTGNDMSLPALFNSLLKQYPWLTYHDFHYKAFNRRTQLERNHERTPVHGIVIPVFNALYNCDVESEVDWTRFTPKQRKTPLLLIPKEVVNDWINAGNEWIDVGPDVILSGVDRDPRREFSNSLEFQKSLFRRFGKCCYWCKRPLPNDAWVADHFYPWSKGGRTVLSNCVPACFRCNQDKRDKWPTDYLIAQYAQLSYCRIASV